MRPDFLHCLLKLALAAAFLPVLARAEDARGLPQHLGVTGLYVAGSLSQVSPDVLPFSPQYPLWSDGAAKRRWIWLPPGTSIDASSPDAWDFPRGTKLWKQFAHGSVIETRYIERGADGAWRFGSYVWNADGTDAVLAPARGIRDLPAPKAPGARYTIPSEDDCRACHEGAPVPVLGFSALQLDYDNSVADDVDMKSLHDGSPDWLPSPPTTSGPPYWPLPSDPTGDVIPALGYLYANCGHCHNPSSGVMNMTPILLRMTTTTLSSLATTPPYVTTVDVDGKAIGDGRPGPVARAFRRLYIEEARKD